MPGLRRYERTSRKPLHLARRVLRCRLDLLDELVNVEGLAPERGNQTVAHGFRDAYLVRVCRHEHDGQLVTKSAEQAAAFVSETRSRSRAELR